MDAGMDSRRSSKSSRDLSDTRATDCMWGRQLELFFIFQLGKLEHTSRSPKRGGGSPSLGPPLFHAVRVRKG